MAAPHDDVRDVLERELYTALQTLHDLEHATTAQASVEHASAMIRIWSLRFQISNIEYDSAHPIDESSLRLSARNAMREASVQLDAWEKRKSVAQADLVNDILLAAMAHEAAQGKLASELEGLE